MCRRARQALAATAVLICCEHVAGFAGRAPTLQSSQLHQRVGSTNSKRLRSRPRSSVCAIFKDTEEALTQLPTGGTVCFDGACDYRDEPVTSTQNPFSSSEDAEQPRSSKGSKPTVWSEFSALATETGAINLGQGFPNWEPPDFVIQAGIKAMTSGHNQYTRTAGHPRLVELLAGRYTKHFGRAVDPYAQVAITIGASQALYITMQVLLSPGDEVVLLEPFFDLYVGQIKMAHGVPAYVPLQPRGDTWHLDAAALRAAITPRTRAIVLNSPHNPTGKVFSRAELLEIADIVREHPRLMVISDEVYKYMVYGCGGGGALSATQHVHFATLPGMWDRTVTISSAGKTFSVTGWQVGWVLGPKWLIKEVQTALPYMQFCAATPLQEAMATAIETADLPYKGHASYYDWLRQQYTVRRDRLATALRNAGIPSMKGEGGFFLIGDISAVTVPDRYLQERTPAMPDAMTKDWAFCRWMAIEHGVIAIPTSPFFQSSGAGSGAAADLQGKYVRFCFCKTDETLDAAAEALAAMSKVAAVAPAGSAV